jgi:hypothetical protein
MVREGKHRRARAACKLGGGVAVSKAGRRAEPPSRQAAKVVIPKIPWRLGGLAAASAVSFLPDGVFSSSPHPPVATHRIHSQRFPMPKKRTPQKGPKSRTDRAPVEPIPIKALYSVGDLAKGLSLPWRKVKKLLADCGVKFMRCDRSWLVPLTEIEENAPALWDKIVAGQRARRDTE